MAPESTSLMRVLRESKSLGVFGLSMLSVVLIQSCKSDTSNNLSSSAVSSGGSSGGGGASNGGSNGGSGLTTNPLPLPPLPTGYSYTDFFVIAGPAPLSSNPNPPTFKSVHHAQASSIGNAGPTLNADWTQPCHIPAGSANTDLICNYEIEEADLYFSGTECYRSNGFTPVSGFASCGGNKDDRIWLTYNIPSAASCPYFTFEPYYYWKYEPGYGPTVVTQTITPTGTTYADTSGDGINATINTATGKCVDKTNNAIPIDNTVLGGPNCCYGKYTLNTITVTTSVTNGVTTTNTSSSVSQQDYGGDLSQCIDGPAANPQIWPLRNSINSANLPNAGFPVAEVIDTSSTPSSQFPMTTTFAFGGGNSVGNSANFFSANYYDPPGGTVAANYFTNMFNIANMPAGISGQNAAFRANFAYRASCLDHAGDVLSRITLFIRPWSADSQFALTTAGVWDTATVSPITAAPFTQGLNRDVWGTTGAVNYLTHFPFGAD